MTEMVDMEKLARIWRKMQDARDALNAKFEADDQAIADKQALVGASLLSAMNSLKADKLSTGAGVIERKVKTKVSGADWTAIYRFIRDGNGDERFALLHKRVGSQFVEAWKKEHETYPPGVNVFEEYEIGVKKPSSKELPAE